MKRFMPQCRLLGVPSLYARKIRRNFGTSCIAFQQQQENKFDILLDQIKLEPSVVRESLSKLKEIYGEGEFNKKITLNVQVHFKNDHYNLSLFQSLIGSRYRSHNVNMHMNSILTNNDLKDIERFNKLISYLQMLSTMIPRDNFQDKLALKEPIIESLLSVTPRDKYKELFILLLNVNYKITYNSAFYKLFYHLRTGSAQEFYTFLNAKLPFEDSKNDSDQLMKNNYSILMFSQILRVYIRLGNHLKFSKIVSLMFQKIEDENTKIPKRYLLSRAYEHLMAYILKKYDLRPCLLLLQDMQNNNIPISNRMLMIILNRLTMDSDLKNFAILTNYILELYKRQSQKLDATSVQVITNQTLKIIQNSKFSYNDLKVIIGYTISFFGKSEPLLQELGLLRSVYGEDQKKFLKADISNQLNVLQYPPITSLEQIYKAFFRYMNFNKTMTLSILKNLYINFRNTALQVQEQEKYDEKLKHHPLASKNLNDKILKLFMRQLLFRFTSFEGAAELLDDFSRNFNVKLSNSYVYDMIIKYYLRRDNLINAFRWFDKLVRDHNEVRVNIRPLVQLIIKSYELQSENSKRICELLICDHLAPLIKCNVYEPHLNPKLKQIVKSLNLEHLFDLNLPEVINDNAIRPGRTLNHVLDFENVFGENLIDSFRDDFSVDVDDIFGDNTIYNHENDLKPQNSNFSKMMSIEIKEDEEDEIFDISDMETGISLEPQDNDTFEFLSTIPEVPEIEYDEPSDSELHPTAPIVDTKNGLNESLQEISSVASPSYESMIRHDESLFKKRKQFLKLLEDATNDDLMILLIKFLQNCEDEFIFFESNNDYATFQFQKSKTKKLHKKGKNKNSII